MRLFGQYHSPQTSLMKSELLTNLTSNDSFARVIFATSSLGMGVDAPNIRCIIHIKPPSSIEEYTQMIGRGGRSGEPCTAKLYYCLADVSNNVDYIDNEMKSYCTNKEVCLREYIMKYFGFACGRQEVCCTICDGSDEGPERLQKEEQPMDGMTDYFNALPFDLGI